MKFKYIYNDGNTYIIEILVKQEKHLFIRLWCKDKEIQWLMNDGFGSWAQSLSSDAQSVTGNIPPLSSISSASDRDQQKKYWLYRLWESNSNCSASCPPTGSRRLASWSSLPDGYWLRLPPDFRQIPAHLPTSPHLHIPAFRQIGTHLLKELQKNREKKLSQASALPGEYTSQQRIFCQLYGRHNSSNLRRDCFIIHDPTSREASALC